METKIELPSIDAALPKSDGFSIKAIPGKIANLIGSGHYAQAAIVFTVIRYSFWMALGLSVLIYFRPLMFDQADPASTITDIERVWSLFIPVITLGLGYVFGKGKE
jgi:hypothetical protein